jgi:hypothetical protein
MKMIALLAGLIATVSLTPALAESASGTSTVSVNKGKLLFDSAGHRIGTIYRVSSDGNPQVILNGHLVTVPASTLSNASGKIMTSLSRADLDRAQ